jgi:hypothetical protein
MVGESLEFPLIENGHTGKRRASLVEKAGWNVSVELDDRVMTVARCADWHRVELRSRIERLLRQAADADTGNDPRFADVAPTSLSS